MQMVHQLVAMLRMPHSAVHEHLIKALVISATDYPEIAEQCRDPDLHLEALLEERMTSLKGQEEFEVGTRNASP